MDAIQISESANAIQFTIPKKGIDSKSLLKAIRLIHLEYLAHRVDFDESIMEVAEDINRGWWARNKTQILEKINGKTESK